MKTNIFYADDDEDDRDIFIDAASEVSDNLEITTHSNGAELLKLLKNPPPYPDLIFLDLNMPVKNGYDVLKEIKEHDEFKNIGIIILSTSDNPSAIKTTRQLGANLYIPKPSSFSNLKKAIEYSLSIKWDTFNPDDSTFVYGKN